MKKVLFIQKKIHHYRISFFNEISKNSDLFVISSYAEIEKSEIKFTFIQKKIYKFGPFLVFKNLGEIIKNNDYDIIVAPFDLRFIQFFYLLFFKRNKVRWVWWGLDQGKSKTALKIKLLFAKMNIPIVYYHKKILHKFLKLGVRESCSFVANNSFHIPNRIEAFLNDDKNSFINVGSLDERKNNKALIHSFKNVLSRTHKDIKLYLIGEGSEKNELIKLVSNLSLQNSVIFTGRINDPNILSKYYYDSFSSVSYGQAGLAVLQSMANGVPFITHEKAISGGEIHNINHERNGILVNNQNQLEEWMIFFINNPKIVKSIGENAYNFYSNNCTIENMAKNFNRVFKDVKKL